MSAPNMMVVPYAPVHNVRAYGAVGDGTTDDTAAIQAAIDAASEFGGSVYFPAGEYVLTETGELDGRGFYYSLRIPTSGIRLEGEGTASTILTKLPLLSDLDDPTNVVSWIWVDSEADDVQITGLRFLGEAPELAIDQYSVATNHRFNLQMAVVQAEYNTNSQAVPPLRSPSRLTIQSCTFEKQYGFVAVQYGIGDGYVFADNVVIDCHNGVNLNGSHLRCTGNQFLRSEGFECAGSFGVFSANTFRDAVLSAIGVGGDQTQGASGAHYGTVVAANVIDRTVASGTLSNTHGIIVAQNMNDTLVVDNVVERTYGHGIIAVPTSTLPSRRLQILDNTVTAAGHANSTERVGIFVSVVQDVTIRGNRISNTLEDGSTRIFSDYMTAAGIVIDSSTDVMLGWNDIRVEAASTPVSIQSSTGVRTDTPDGILLHTGTADTYPIWARGNRRVKIVVTDVDAKTINPPTNGQAGQTLTFDIRNAISPSSAMGSVTFNSVFKTAGAFVSPAAGKRRTITFYFDGTDWTEVARSAADIQ